MPNIQLTRGQFALVDDIDADLICFNWKAIPDGKGSNARWYAACNALSANGKKSTVYMHRAILERAIGRKLGPSEGVDHKNHDGTDNRRENLRIATYQENTRNRRMHCNKKTSHYKGVSWDEQHNKWKVQICVNGKRTHLAYCGDEDKAARVYDQAAKKIFKSFCTLNFISDDPTGEE